MIDASRVNPFHSATTRRAALELIRDFAKVGADVGDSRREVGCVVAGDVADQNLLCRLADERGHITIRRNE